MAADPPPPAQAAPPAPIEAYGLIGNCRSAALVGRNGAIDWLCWPRFDSPACFAALLGSPANGRWLIAPADPVTRITRRYLPATMVLETVFETGSGSVSVTDFMAMDRDALIRIVRGISGQVVVRSDLAPCFQYGSSVPSVRHDPNRVTYTAGSETMVLYTDHDAQADNAILRPGMTLSFCLAYGADTEMLQAEREQAAAVAWWTGWSGQGVYRGPWQDAVQRALLTLKALTCSATGGIVAAPTTSLPEQLGGPRNWDYRYCWLRDSSLTVRALLLGGHQQEARAWTAWLQRAVADGVQTLYGVGGERAVPEWEVPWLAGYGGAGPVRIGNAASGQLQIDVYGELLDTLLLIMRQGVVPPDTLWSTVLGLIAALEATWRQPDESIWEVRGAPRHFTVSKVMAWVALDRAIQAAETFALAAPLDRWRALRGEIHDLVCQAGFSAARNSFTQSFGNDALDASLLLMPLFGFLPAQDPRIAGTVDAIGEDLMAGGLILRYRTEQADDGLAGTEGVFLACGFWYVQALARLGRLDQAQALFAHMVGLNNDLGLLAEEYDPVGQRQLGNFPQGFSHLALVEAAFALQDAAAA